MFISYERQRKPGMVEVQVDTDYAGCLKTRKSTSGGILEFGKHVINTWSHTQAVIALSSGEVEYYGMLKGASYGLGIQYISGSECTH